MSIEVTDANFCRAALFVGTIAGGLRDRIAFLEPVAHADARVVAIADLVHRNGKRYKEYYKLME
jgi:hypothetical protein